MMVKKKKKEPSILAAPGNHLESFKHMLSLNFKNLIFKIFIEV